MATRFVCSECMALDDVERAPSCKGLYVWYARLRLGKAVYDSANAGGEDEARKQTSSALRRHTSKHRQQPLKVDALANFSVSWTGSITCLADAYNDADANLGEIDDLPSFLSAAVSKPGTRKDLLNMVDAAFPTFLSPLYIGMTIDQTLQQRLLVHKNRFVRYWEQSQRDPTFVDRFENPKNFAERAVKVGLTPRDIHFFTLHIEGDSELTNSDQDDLIRSAEWLLNRWSSPLLGRQ